MKSSVLGVIRVRSRGANDEASEYILKATINGLPVIGVYASVAPVPDSLVFQYQDPTMPSDPPKNARFWHDTQATVSMYESWTVTLVGNTEGRDRTEAIRKVQTYLRCLAHEFLIESVCIRIGDLRPYVISDAVTYQVLYEGFPSKMSEIIAEDAEGKL